MAPAILLYSWGLHNIPRGGIALTFLFVCGGATRLARFNIQHAIVDRRFFVFQPPAAETYRDDEITARLRQTALPYRALDLGVYRGSWLMAHRIPTLLGYHGNELRWFDELLGGKNEWRNLGDPALFDLQHFVLPTRLPSRELYDLLLEYYGRSTMRVVRKLLKTRPQVFLSSHAPKIAKGMLANAHAFKNAHIHIPDRKTAGKFTISDTV